MKVTLGNAGPGSASKGVSLIKNMVAANKTSKRLKHRLKTTKQMKPQQVHLSDRHHVFEHGISLVHMHADRLILDAV